MGLFWSRSAKAGAHGAPRAGRDGQRTPPAPVATPPKVEPPRREEVIASGLHATAVWSVRLLAIGLAAWALGWVGRTVWVGLLPIILALIVSSALWPAVRGLRAAIPAGLAAALVLLGAVGASVGILTWVLRPVADQFAELADGATAGLERLREWLAGPPFDIDSQQINQAATALGDRLQSSAGQIAGGVFTGVSAVGSATVTFVLVLVLSFLFLKDGPAFLPWVRRQAGEAAGHHLSEVLSRVWDALSNFIRVQAIVAFVDALLIGVGLWLLGVPLAAALAVLTFFASFIPIVGAIVAGTLAVLIALVSNGLTSALLVLALIVVVQQVESNLLQPFLQGRTLQLHAGIVIMSVTAGGTLYGVTGAFLAVPTAAAVTTSLRYLSEQADRRSR